MYLTKIEMDLGNRAVREALADCQKMHRLLNGLCEVARGDAQLLYRLKNAGRTCSAYLYSAEPLCRGKCLPFMEWAGERDISALVSGFRNGKVMRFDLVTMPSKKVPAGNGKNSQRRVLRLPEERIEWLRRKAEQNGFSILQVQELEGTDFSGNHGMEKGSRMVWNAYHYSGLLEVADEAAFRKAFSSGIGPGKAYGLGMILLF